MGLTLMEQMKVVGVRFGDEESKLLDRFERLSFEIHLNQAILGRSLSQPATFSNYYSVPLPSSPSSSPRRLEEKNVTKKSRFMRALNRLFHLKASKKIKQQQQQGSNFSKLKAFSRSLRT